MSRAAPWTMQQIAEAAGVSTTTVSHALSGKRPVSAETADRIARVIEEVGYAPDAAGTRLRTGRSRIVQLVVPDISHWYFGRIAVGAEEVARDAGYGLVVASTSSDDPQQSRYLDMARSRAVDGLIYAASRVAEASGSLAAIARVAPVVLADEAVPSLAHLPTVTSTIADGARAAGEHLRGLGHRRAVELAGPSGLPSTHLRAAAFRRSMDSVLTLHGDYSIDAGYALASDLLANEVRFTCLFAHNDFMAVGAMRRLAEAGIRVPEDVSVIGFDDAEIAQIVSPALTTVRKDMREVGRRSMTLLLGMLEHDEPPVSEILPVELVVRASTAPAIA